MSKTYHPRKPTYTPKEDIRKLPDSMRAVRIAVSASRGGSFLLLWGAKNSMFSELYRGRERFNPSTFLDVLPRAFTVPGVVDWPGLCDQMREKLGVEVHQRQVTYLRSHRAAKKVEEVGLGGAREVGDVLSEGTLSFKPGDWGFERIHRGQVPAESFLNYLSPARRRSADGATGRTADEHIGRAVDYLYSTLAKMRSRAGGAERADLFSAWAFSAAELWPLKKPGEHIAPLQKIRELQLAPELWIRRRITRRTSTLSLSIYGTRRGADGLWEVVDLTPLAALHCSGSAPKCPLWRRAVYLVDRGDGLEWVILHPSRDECDFLAAHGIPSGVRGEVYEGSPARTLVSTLQCALAPRGEAVRVRWIRDDKPLTDAGEVK